MNEADRIVFIRVRCPACGDAKIAQVATRGAVRYFRCRSCGESFKVAANKIPRNGNWVVAPAALVVEDRGNDCL